MSIRPNRNEWLRIYGGLSSFNLLCFHNVGGSAQTFKSWTKDLSNEIGVCAVQLPGRRERIGEPFCTNLESILESVLEEMEPLLKAPYAIVGYSMGALLGFELMRRIRRAKLPDAKCFFPIGLSAPQLPKTPRNWHLLSDTELVNTLAKVYGAIPDLVLREPDLIKMVLPVLRADLSIAESYRYYHEEKLDIPIFAFAGERDQIVNKSSLAAWGEQTLNTFVSELVPGGHLFIDPTNQKQFLAKISGLLTTERFNPNGNSSRRIKSA